MRTDARTQRRLYRNIKVGRCKVQTLPGGSDGVLIRTTVPGGARRRNLSKMGTAWSIAEVRKKAASEVKRLRGLKRRGIC